MRQYLLISKHDQNENKNYQPFPHKTTYITPLLGRTRSRFLSNLNKMQTTSDFNISVGLINIVLKHKCSLQEN